MHMFCPICGSKFNITEYHEGYTLMESYGTCNNHYVYHYNTGSTFICVGDIEFYIHYRDSREQLDIIYANIDKAIDAYIKANPIEVYKICMAN